MLSNSGRQNILMYGQKATTRKNMWTFTSTTTTKHTSAGMAIFFFNLILLLRSVPIIFVALNVNVSLV